MDNLRQALAKRNFVVFGRVGMDLCPHPAGSKTEDASTFVSGLGGSSANIAAGLCKFGSAAALVTSVSDDAIGRYCLNQLAQYDVDAAHVKSVGGEYRNSLAIYESRVVEHQTVIYRNGAADFQVTRDDVEAVDYVRYGALITAGTVFAAEPSRGATFHAFDLAKAAGLPIIFDIDYRPYSWPSPQVAADVLSRAGGASDVIVGNDEEFGFMAGDVDQGLAKARELAATTATVVVYKMGEHGAITITKDGEIRTGIYPVEALKPTGAGDSFMAGFIAALADGRDLKDSALRGSACAAIVVSKVGCAPAMPNLAQLEDFLSSHPGVSKT